SYSDMGSFDVHCYDLQEILLEKLRAAMQRGKTRDYYDLWQLMTRKDLMRLSGEDDEENDNELGRIRNNLVNKCKNKGVPYEPEVIFSEAQLGEAENEWQNSLGRLVKSLPEFNKVISDLKKIFWREAELAEFSKTFDANLLRNLRRGEVVSPLLRRSVELIALKLSSNKVSEIIRALNVIEQMYAVMPEMHVFINKQITPQLEKLSTDKDNEIKRKALAIRKGIIDGKY
ncbi:MAG: nucleotidyl transferase AbiEii/AbiGii toxin family protein, partial [Candidatus Micrarchaeota archaeon]